jgi:hypothetical protein
VGIGTQGGRGIGCGDYFRPDTTLL